jgi:hypothetical protein
MAYTLPADSYGSGKINGTHHEREAEPAKLHAAPPTPPLALAEARVSQVEAELRLILVREQVADLEERLSHLEAELATCRRAAVTAALVGA